MDARVSTSFSWPLGRGPKALAVFTFAGFACAYLLAAFLISIPGPIGETVAGRAGLLVNGYFAQSWKLFAPQISTANSSIVLIVRYRTASGAIGASKPFDASTSVIDLAKADRIAPSRVYFVDDEIKRDVVHLVRIERQVVLWQRDHPHQSIPDQVAQTLAARDREADALLEPYGSSFARGIILRTLPKGATIYCVRAIVTIQQVAPPYERLRQEPTFQIYDTGWFHPQSSVVSLA